MAIQGANRGRNTKKCDFFEKSRKNIWWICEKALPLHSQTRNEGCLREKASTLVARESFKNGALVQLVRIHACHAWGHGFESRTHRFSLWFGSLAQLNRASDYGSEGCRFESCMSHHSKSSRLYDGCFFVSEKEGQEKKNLRRIFMFL